MTRGWIAGALAALAVAGCTGGGTIGGEGEDAGKINTRTPGRQMLAIVRAQAAGLFGSDEARAPAGPQPTRAQLDQIPFATIAFEYGGLPPVYMIPLSDNGGYLTYQDEGRRGVVLLGGAVAGTDGLGEDLRAVKHASNDPIAYQRPLADWPDFVARSYQYRVRDLAEYIVTVACELTPADRVAYEIVERRYVVTRVEETCRNAAREFRNRYWVDDAGFVWASEQWLGPNLEPARIEIVRPYAR